MLIYQASVAFGIIFIYIGFELAQKKKLVIGKGKVIIIFTNI
jgi:hypothetical protein